MIGRFSRAGNGIPDLNVNNYIVNYTEVVAKRCAFFVSFKHFSIIYSSLANKNNVKLSQ